MMPCALEPEAKWDEFQSTLAKRVAELPPPPVSIAWTGGGGEEAEQLMAAIYASTTPGISCLSAATCVIPVF